MQGKHGNDGGEWVIPLGAILVRTSTARSNGTFLGPYVKDFPTRQAVMGIPPAESEEEEEEEEGGGKSHHEV